MFKGLINTFYLVLIMKMRSFKICCHSYCVKIRNERVSATRVDFTKMLEAHKGTLALTRLKYTI